MFKRSPQPQKPQQPAIGFTQDFVIAQGVIQLDDFHAAIVGADGSKRLFAELFADPDRPEVRPQDAFASILSSMQPGWTIRVLQIFWPDPAPRQVFFNQVYSRPAPEDPGLQILHEGLLIAIQRAALPFVRRTVIEFVLPGEEGLAWWDGLAGLCAGYGIVVSYIDLQGIRTLARWTLNPSLEQHATENTYPPAS